jgi:hypothetical protein
MSAVLSSKSYTLKKYFLFFTDIITFYNFVDVNPLAAIKTNFYYIIKNTFVETSARKVLHSTLCMYVIPRRFDCFQSLILFSIVYYSETLFIDSKSTYIGDQLLPNRERYDIRHHSCMRLFYRFSVW